MKLLHLANDFSTSNNNPHLVPVTPVTKPSGISNQGKTRFTSFALLILLVFAGFSLTIPLHPTNNSGPAGCNNGVVLAAAAANCTGLAAVKINYTAVVNTLSNLAVGNLPGGKRSSVSETSKLIFSNGSQVTDTSRHYFTASRSY